MNLICDCLRKHQNGGVCDCFDNNLISDWDDDAEIEDNNWEDVKIEEDDDPTKIAKKWDDFLH